MLLLWIAGLLEGVWVDLQAPAVRRWVPVNVRGPTTNLRGRMVPEWPSGFL